MLFKKQDTFDVNGEYANCIVKYGLQNAEMTFKSGIWYIFHFDDFELNNNNQFYLDGDNKSLVNSDSNGSSDGFVDARENNQILTITGRAFIMFLDNVWEFPVLPGSGGRGYGSIKIISNEPIYTNIQDITVINRSLLSLKEISIHIASTFKLVLYNYRDYLGFDNWYNIGNDKSGIKSGQFIL